MKAIKDAMQPMNFKLRIHVGLLNTHAIIKCDNKAVIDDISACGFSDWAIYSEFDLLRLAEGLYDIEGAIEHVDGVLEYGELKATEVVDKQEITVKDAMQILTKEMQSEGSDKGSYAHAWHCNIAMASYDTFKEEVSDHYKLHTKANEAASRFMKILFDVETKA